MREPAATTPLSTTSRRFIGVSLPSIGDEEVEELLDVIRSGWVTTGPKTAELQDLLAEYLGVAHVRCTASCTAALSLALRVAGAGPGAEVLLPTMTFVSCANAVVHAGATPVFVDADPATGHVDLTHAASLVSERTIALLAVHLGGLPLDMDAICAFRDRHGLTVIEDAAHAIGARWRGVPIGAHGNPTAFSFHATKNMTTFEGGALVLTDGAAAERVERLSLHGLSRSAWSRHGASGPEAYDVPEPGFKCGMHDVAAAVGIHQLGRLDARIERREALARLYDEALVRLPLDLPPHAPAHGRHARHIYPVQMRDEAPLDRSALIEALRQRGIGTSVHFRPIHTYSYYAEQSGLAPEALPVAEALGRRLLTLPLFPTMEDDDVLYVAECMRELLGR
jgi:dTDP-4-amino-4,6-dideoxygalactose transaminase